MLRVLGIGKRMQMHQNTCTSFEIVVSALNFQKSPSIGSTRSFGLGVGAFNLRRFFMRTNNLHRPTYKFQTQRQKQIWHPSLSWLSRAGRCLAIAKNQNGTFSVLLEGNGRARWTLVEQVLSEAEVVQWIQIAATNKGV